MTLFGFFLRSGQDYSARRWQKFKVTICNILKCPAGSVVINLRVRYFSRGHLGFPIRFLKVGFIVSIKMNKTDATVCNSSAFHPHFIYSVSCFSVGRSFTLVLASMFWFREVFVSRPKISCFFCLVFGDLHRHLSYFSCEVDFLSSGGSILL